jgi:hypothetical protein
MTLGWVVNVEDAKLGEDLSIQLQDSTSLVSTQHIMPQRTKKQNLCSVRRNGTLAGFTAITSLVSEDCEKVSDDGLCALAGLTALTRFKGSEAGQCAQPVV